MCLSLHCVYKAHSPRMHVCSDARQSAALLEENPNARIRADRKRKVKSQDLGITFKSIDLEIVIEQEVRQCDLQHSGRKESPWAEHHRTSH